MILSASVRGIGPWRNLRSGTNAWQRKRGIDRTWRFKITLRTLASHTRSRCEISSQISRHIRIKRWRPLRRLWLMEVLNWSRLRMGNSLLLIETDLSTLQQTHLISLKPSQIKLELID